MSCGLGSPSTTVSPFSTCSPSNTMIWRYFGISSSCSLPSAVLDDQALLALGVLAEADDARDLGEDRRVLRLARFEQVGHARQTTGDVAGLRRFLRDLRDHVAHADRRAVLQVDDRARRQQVLRRQVGTRDVQVLAVLVDDADDRTQVLALRAATLRIGDLARSQAGQFVGLLDDGDAVDEVDEAHRSRPLPTRSGGYADPSWRPVWPALIAAPSLTWMVAPYGSL